MLLVQGPQGVHPGRTAIFQVPDQDQEAPGLQDTVELPQRPGIGKPVEGLHD